ncbi:hypothetical protein [Oerskovia enterophila]|uniref:hypothetical protein n=1 Tax=Oerskovia enterophila TaxID=43678 RepID=UPI00339B05D1
MVMLSLFAVVLGMLALVAGLVMVVVVGGRIARADPVARVPVRASLLGARKTSLWTMEWHVEYPAPNGAPLRAEVRSLVWTPADLVFSFRVWVNPTVPADVAATPRGYRRQVDGLVLGTGIALAVVGGLVAVIAMLIAAVA